MDTFIQISATNDIIKSSALVSKKQNQSGLLAYEYNPLKVLRLNDDTYIEDNSGLYIYNEETKLYEISDSTELLKYTLYPKNSIVDLDTEHLHFDLSSPADIDIQPSYDGSVNLLITDNNNEPRLINTRFTCTGNNTYSIVDRLGNNDSNIYNENNFQLEASLYKKISKIPKLTFIGTSTGGNMKVGNYVFYFKLMDEDSNETDIIAESGIVTCHIGHENDPNSIRGGLLDENSYKQVNFTLTNIDSGYSYVSVYYTRNTGDLDTGLHTTTHKIHTRYHVHNGVAKICINGFEHSNPIDSQEINQQYAVIQTAKTLVQCQNMLFLGNVTLNAVDTKELSDLSLRFTPHLDLSEDIGRVDDDYKDDSGKYEYYNVNNLYYRLGYWNEEIYRIGVVYIMNDFTLSPVFNVRGHENLTLKTKYETYDVYKNGERKYIPTNSETSLLPNGENSKGVIRINYSGNQLDDKKTVPIGLKFTIDNDALLELKKHTKGLFFVRLKRIKTILGQMVTVGLDANAETPILNIDGSYKYESFISTDRLLTHDYSRRMRELDELYVRPSYAGLCPEYNLNLAFFNNFLTGSDMIITSPNYLFKNDYFKQKVARLVSNTEYTKRDTKKEYNVSLTAVPEDTKAVKGKWQYFSSRAGEAEEASSISYAGYKNRGTGSTNLIRGIYCPYIGIENLNDTAMDIYNIRIPGYNESNMKEYFDIRFRDSSLYSAISDRMSWDEIKKSNDIYGFDKIFRGDCYICNYTMRVIRNFLDPETPTISDFVDPETWKENYSVGEDDSDEKLLSLNRGDVNAVMIGHWATLKVCSNVNLSMRCQDPFYITEHAMTGRPRGFYPLNGLDASGEGKIPESSLMSVGFNVSTADKVYVPNIEVPASLPVFNTRIMHSDVAVNNAFKNNYRVFRSLNYFDYPAQYGSLVRLMEWSDNIVAIFEHGVSIISVNEKALAVQGTTFNAFVTTNNVLTDSLLVLSDTFGTLWPESVVQTPYAIYGVDTVAKKIWKVHITGSLNKKFTLSVISDFKVLKFLNDNITLSLYETLPIVGIRNVKSHYNAFKSDIMFTFYDDINTIEEKVWNLCYNEILDKFITYYSWIPSYSASIDNIFFTFDRNTSKDIAKLYKDTSLIQVTNNTEDNEIIGKRLVITNLEESKLGYYVGTLSIPSFENAVYSATNQNGEQFTGLDIQYLILDDAVTNEFAIYNNKLYIMSDLLQNKIYRIPVKATITSNVLSNTDKDMGSYTTDLYASITRTTKSYLNSSLERTSFWKHGQAGLMKTKDPIKPTNWYGKQHPFEFEVVVCNSPASHKIFNDILLIANKAEPESLHFEITGEVYKFADDKKNIYFRQEALKHIYQYNGSNVKYNKDYLDIIPELRSIPYSLAKDKSTAFPIYYSRVDTLDSVEDYYQGVLEIGKDYLRMSGTEIIYDKTKDEYKIATHIKACPIGKVYKLPITKELYLQFLHYPNFITENGKYYKLDTYGRRNGNIQYKEDIWYAQIPSIVYYEKNENEWFTHNDVKYPPLLICNNPLPEDTEVIQLSDNNIPLKLKDLGYVTTNPKGFTLEEWPNRKETRLRDRYLRVKIRYSGKDLAIIYALKTMFTVSYV